MKAFFKPSFSSSIPSVFGEVPAPVSGTNQLLIAVKAASINPVDYKLNNAYTGMIPGAKLPKIVGTDFAGVVVKAAANDHRFKTGDRVYGATPIFFGKPGAMAEFLVTDADNARLIPDEMSFTEAASLPVAALTALNGLRRCGVTKGTRLLINGATGGVGHFAVQIAKAMGAHITATCSNKNRELALLLGANEVVSYPIPPAEGNQPPFEAIMDAWGQMRFKDYAPLIAKGGTYASPLILFAPKFFTNTLKVFTGIRITSSNMRAKPEDYAYIEHLFLQQKLKPVIEATFPLAEAAEAFETTQFGKPRGKVVVNIAKE